MKNKFFMLVGLPGSGKSYVANKLLEESLQMAEAPLETIWLSSDKMREELYGSEEEQGNPSKVFEEMRIRTERALKEGKNVVYDACNVNAKKRTAFLNNLKRYACEKICIVCATPYQECLDRNNHRSRIVPEEVIKRMYMNWNTPYFYEGWDDIWIQYAENASGCYGTITDYVEKQMEFEQDNPFHLESLGEHLKGTYEYLVKHYGCEPTSNLAIAALIHDCGKPFAKVFHDTKGNATEIAHYYLHQGNGAYDAMFYQFENKNTYDVLEISVLINLHMHPFGWKAEKTCGKQKKLWGEKLYQDILRLHEADKAASCSAEDSNEK